MVCPNCGREMAEENGVLRCRFCGCGMKDSKSVRKSRFVSLAAGIAATVFALLFLFAGFMLIKDSVIANRSRLRKDGKSNAPVRIAFTGKYIELPVGETRQILPSISPKGAETGGIEWESSDPSVAAVDDNGLVSAIAPGSAVVSASIGGVRAEAEVFVYRELLELLAGRIQREGSFDEDYGWYFLPVLYEENEEEGLLICRNTELIWAEGSNEVALCCDVFDADVNVFYETFVNFTFGDKQKAAVYFYCSCGSSEGGEPSVLPVSQPGVPAVTEAEARGSLIIPAYSAGDHIALSDYDGDPEFRDTAERIAASMVGYSLGILKIRWNSLGVSAPIGEILGLAKL